MNATNDQKKETIRPNMTPGIWRKTLFAAVCRRRTLGGLGKLVLAGSLLAGASSPCLAGIFTPRSGEFFQTTREGPGCAALFPLAFGIYFPPAGVVLVPIGTALAAIDELVISPAVDLVCLPYDALCPNHGYYLRFVDEDGKPIPGVNFSATSYYGVGISSRITDEVSDADGEIYIPRLSEDHHITWISATKEGYYDFTPLSLPGHSDNFTFHPAKSTPGDDGRIVCQLTLRKIGKQVDMVHSVLNIPQPVARVKSEVLLYDCAEGAWLPPYGNGKVADLKVDYRLANEPKAGEKLPWHASYRIELSAVRPEDGLIVKDVFRHSKFTFDHTAPTEAKYVQRPDQPAVVWERENQRYSNFPDGKYCIFRLRTELGTDGTIHGAHYGLLAKTGGCLMSCHYCRDENETSLESNRD